MDNAEEAMETVSNYSNRNGEKDKRQQKILEEIKTQNLNFYQPQQLLNQTETQKNDSIFEQQFGSNLFSWFKSNTGAKIPLRSSFPHKVSNKEDLFALEEQIYDEFNDQQVPINDILAETDQ